jgi:hypothetical protein
MSLSDKAPGLRDLPYRLRRLLSPRLPRARGDLGDIFEQYEERLPAPQNAIDAVPGWCTSLPGVEAGPLSTYSDIRICWLAEQFGDLQGRSVLELGPLEGGHSAQLESLGANVLAIEANKLAYMRCLVAKEIFGLVRARFLLGDFVKWLERDERRYDLVLASGVLYHMHEPVRLLELMAARTDALYLWTHYVDDAVMPVGDPRRYYLTDEPEIVPCAGVPVRVYRRTYFRAERDVHFSGGMVDNHSWVHKDDIIAVLTALGFATVLTAHDVPDHQNGPSFSVFARRAG